MKKIALALALSLLTISMFAQISQNRNCSNFKGIKASGAIKVILTEGQEYSVKVVAPEEDQQKVITEVSNEILKIYTKEGNYKSDIIVYVTAKALNAIKASGASKIESNTILNVDKLAIESSGASEIIVELKAQELTANVSGASSLKLKGFTRLLTADVSGASSLKAYNLSAGVVDVSATGASSAKINVSEKASLIASGASEVIYMGNPKDKTVEANGASTIKHNEKEEN